eukprot:NODE_4686_length_560_cov_233.583170_g3418_i0.p1 GENE.NODE_4686_length_560_cov_233.583170_g3418_i0~~NODE_4686_length_560_cov_233.583170_g3418_i0.p1  ORF type:complete len:178 (-),score=51.44 NODE_4686_length_560_cov_233.583170_g3418_i0:27-497(-)
MSLAESTGSPTPSNGPSLVVYPSPPTYWEEFRLRSRTSKALTRVAQWAAAHPQLVSEEETQLLNTFGYQLVWGTAGSGVVSTSVRDVGSRRAALAGTFCALSALVGKQFLVPYHSLLTTLLRSPTQLGAESREAYAVASSGPVASRDGEVVSGFHR